MSNWCLRVWVRFQPPHLTSPLQNHPHHARPPAPPPPPQERNLCATERYLPAQYLAIKAAALKLQEARGRLPRQDFLRLPFQVDPGRMQRCAHVPWELRVL